MELTKKQQEGLRIAVDRFKNHEKYTTISGYAGSGKSTLIKYIIQGILNEGVGEDEVCYATFTGKAAQVLIQKGLTNVFTLHKLLYNCKILDDGTCIFIPKDDIGYGIVVVDECSMMPQSMFDLLMNTQTYLIFCGDPGQLPPVDKEDTNHLLDNPHIFLDEIMRQEQDSGIIRLSMLVREGKSLKGFNSPDAKIITRDQLNINALRWGDIVIAATNKTRHDINNLIRKDKGYPDHIVDGDKIICLRNDWNRAGSEETPLINGAIGTIDNVKIFNQWTPLHNEGKQVYYPAVRGNFTLDYNDEEYNNLLMDNQIFQTGEPSLTPEQIGRMVKMGRNTKRKVPTPFDYGYCITAWKAQGSSWDRVVVIEEDHPFDSEEHRKYLYTAITRAAKQVLLVLK